MPESFSRARIRLASDPQNFTDYTEFTFPRPPVFALLPDTPAVAEMQLADRSYRTDVIGEPARNIDLHVTKGAFLEGADLELWRILKRTGHMVALFPNYDGSTIALTHFENVLYGEIGPTPTLANSPSYVSGVLGSGLKLYGDDKLTYDTSLPTTGSLNMWLQFPADASWGSLNGLLHAGPNVWAGWSHWDNVLAFRLNSTFSFDITATAAQLPSLAAGEWFNLGLSWRSGASRRGRIVINGSSAYTFEKALNADPTFYNTTFGIGYAYVGGSEYFNGTLDEIRVQSGAFWSTDEHGACYDRFAQVTEKILASQVQGHYFRIVSDDLGFVSTAQTDRVMGTIRLQSGYADNAMVPTVASGVWPS